MQIGMYCNKVFLRDKNNVEFSACDQEKITWNFPGSWLALKFIKGVTQLCGVSRGEAFVLSRISKGKVKT